MNKLKLVADELPFLQEWFGHAGAQVALDSSSNTLHVRKDNQGNWHTYAIPALLSANQYRLPGWFTAAIWDDLVLPSLGEPPAEGLLAEWGFQLVALLTASSQLPRRSCVRFPKSSASSEQSKA